MAIASMIIQPHSVCMDRVMEELAAIEHVTVDSTTLKHEIIIVVEAPTLDDVSAVARKIEGITGVAGVFPVYVTTEDEIQFN
jgi:nitrate reductase NapAB chaperone NapD